MKWLACLLGRHRISRVRLGHEALYSLADKCVHCRKIKQIESSEP